jgi:hypothetical protein
MISGMILWNEVMESYLPLWQLIPGQGAVRIPLSGPEPGALTAHHEYGGAE